MKNIQSRREFLASAGKIFGGAAMMTIASPLLTAGGALAENVPEKPAHPFPYVELDPAAAQKAAYEVFNKSHYRIGRPRPGRRVPSVVSGQR